MRDLVLESFLEAQFVAAKALAEASDILELWPADTRRYVAHFNCRGLVCQGDEIRPWEGRFTAGIFFPSDYLRRVEPALVVTWVQPANVWHPNIAPPLICVGRMPPGTLLVDLLHQVYEIITWQRFTPNEHDALNRAACQWARNHREQLPIDSRPLRWRRPER